MGAWSSSLYGNDTTCDVRDMYKSFLEEGINNQNAYEKTLEVCKEYIDCPDEAPLFWYALAETQWKTGRLTNEVKTKALEWIDKEGGIAPWEEQKKGGSWRKTLEKLRAKLSTEQPKEKRFRKRIIPNQNPWAIHDIYAYRVHVKSRSNERPDIYGKYILMQKISEEKSDQSSDIVMRVQIYDRVFDNIPSVDDALETVQSYRLLPIRTNPGYQIKTYEKKVQGIPDLLSKKRPFPYAPIKMSAKMEQYHKDPSYPNDELTYICTDKGLSNKQHERLDVDEDYRTWMSSWMWHDFNYQIAEQFATWQGVEYDAVGDGTFEYPTRMQQAEINAKHGVIS